MTNINTYLTRDLYEASYLLAKDCQLLKLQRSDNFFFFAFSNKKQCEELRDIYWENSGDILVKDYADAIKKLKRIIFQEKNAN